MKIPPKDKYTLLIDSDLYAFSTAIALQEPNPFNPECGDMFDINVAKMVIDTRMRKLTEKFNTCKIVQYFSCSRKNNWRRNIVSSYKMNREGIPSPVGLTELINYMKEQYDYVSDAQLEADDLLGITATDGTYKHAIICSWDKDMLTIPTTIYNSNKDILKIQNRVDAFKFFIYQLIIGDSADGYKGIKGCGPKAAQKLIRENIKTLANIWEPLINLAKTKKHDENYMVDQARMAHILQDGDYNFKTKEVRLWEPDMIPDML